ELWATGRITSKPVANLPSAAEPNPTPPDTLCNYPQKAIDDALRRKKYLDALSAMGNKIVFTPAKLRPLLKHIAQQLDDPEVPSTVTVYRWFKKKLQHNDHPFALLEKPYSRGWFGCRFPTEVQEALIELIETRYLEVPGFSIVDLHDALRVRVHALNQVRAPDNALLLPSYDTVRRAVLAYPAYEQAVAKFGKQEASLRFRTSLASPKSLFKVSE
ncbi:hypothetical protein, partial [Chromobacterium haemolyticum]|uniref:hypothetical protein n=1 Tax=Chromobacterium haemolyticum TaxID=394935 RepID=UPI0012F7106C